MIMRLANDTLTYLIFAFNSNNNNNNKIKFWLMFVDVAILFIYNL